VGATLLRGTSWMARGLQSRRLAYVAAISYALYVAHPLLAHSWLGSGETMVKYAKRPLLVFVLLLVAHLSTFYFEKRWIAIGKRFSARWTGRADQPARQQAG
jgi:peptidoglycan/LPS O-acetylase OafA/YrhL